MDFQNHIKKANDFILSHQAQVKKDNYPSYHLAAPYGWVNDPNGFCYALGHYHLFYQHYPYEAKWGPMHWGHAISDDLIHWQHQPVALAPSEPFDKDGCFSGSAIEHDGKLYLIYTGHVWLKEPDNDNFIREVQCLAVSEDGVHFEKLGVIIEPPEGVMHFRDPKVFKEDDHFALVVGARYPGDEARVLKYVSPDLKTWSLKTSILTAPQQEAFMNECPDTFPLDGQYVVAVSPMGLKPEGIARNNPSISSYAVSTDPEHFDPRSLCEIDHGQDYYAPQSMQAPDGRRIMIAWQTMWKLPFASYEDNWCGMFTLPREVTLQDGRLIQKPVREVASLYKKMQEIGTVNLENDTYRLKKQCKPCYLHLCIKGGQSFETAGVNFGDFATLYLDRQHQELTLLRKENGFFSPRSMKLDLQRDLTLDIYVDYSSLEIFVNDGEDTFSCTFNNGKRKDLHLFAHNGKVEFTAVKLCGLKDILRQQKMPQM